MSESEPIFTKFIDLLHSEQEKSCGLYPAVCVAGRRDFDELYGAAVAVASLTRAIDMSKIVGQSFRFMGVEVFKSHSHDHGFYMGSVDE